MRERPRRLFPVGVVVAAYLAGGVLWIFGTGPLADAVTEVTSIPRWIVEFSKGVLFVAVTALVLQLLLRRRAERLDSETASVHEGARRLSESEARNRLQATALSVAENGVVITGRDGTIEWVNAAFEQMSGYPSSVAVGSTPRLLKSGVQDEAFYRGLWETVLAGQVWRGQVVNRRSDGELYTVNQTITPVVADDGEIQNLVAIQEDVTERVQAANEFEASRVRLQALFDHALDAIILADDHGHYLEVNPAVCELTGYSRDELLGMGPADLAAPDQQPVDVDNQFEQFVQAGTESGAFALVHKDGHVVETEYRAVSSIQPGVHLSVLRDVTARNRMLRVLTAAEAQSRQLAEDNEGLAARLTATFESITDGLCTLDEDWRITYLNARAETLLRQPREELLGREIWEPFAPTVGTEFETTLRRAMTEQVTAELDEYHYPPLDSWFQVAAYPSPQGLTVYIRDVSDQHRDRQELRRVNDDLREANRRLEDVAQLKDDLLSMASHELRTPLTPILGFLEILQARGDLSADQRQMLTVMGANAKRMRRLVEDLLAVSRASAGVLVSHPREVRLEEALRGVLKDRGEEAGPVDLAVGGCRVVVDPQHLEQIVINLLTNASKYGTPPVTVTAEPAGEGRIALEVADRGDGVAPDFQGHMWDRFVQKDSGDRRTARGVGLGLSIVKLLAEANDGTVSYRDGSPAGAVFTVEFPGTCQPEHPQTDHGSNTEGSVQEHGGARSPRGKAGVSPSPRSTDPGPQH